MKKRDPFANPLLQMVQAIIIVGALLWASEFIIDFLKFVHREWNWKDG